jgi:hypothetical protein
MKYPNWKKQGGWIGIAAMAVGAVVQNYQKNKAQQQAKKDTQELSKEGFQRQAWLDQQTRKWQLQDRQRAEGDIAQFRPLAPAAFQNLPVPTQTDTTGLADWDPNKQAPPAIQTPLMQQRNPG